MIQRIRLFYIGEIERVYVNSINRIDRYKSRVIEREHIRHFNVLECFEFFERILFRAKKRNG